MKPDFERRFALDTIGHAARSVTIDATTAERAAVAARFALVVLDRLSATVTLTQGAGGVDAHGRLTAALVQACVVTGDDVPAVIDEAFALRFVSAEQLIPVGDEIELASDDLDLIPHDGAAIDLGEAVAQTLGLALDPFPRSVSDDPAIDGERVWRAGPDARPFAGLEGLLTRR